MTVQAGVDQLLEFSSTIGSNYTAVWNSSTTLVVTILPGSGTGARDVDIIDALATQVGSLVVSVRSSAGLRSANGESQASNSSVVVSAGTWGAAPARVTLIQRTPREVRVGWSVPRVGFQPPRFYVRLCRTDVVATAIEGGAACMGREVDASSAIGVGFASFSKGVREFAVDLAVDAFAVLTATVAAYNVQAYGPAVQAEPSELAMARPLITRVSLWNAASASSGRLSTAGGNRIRVLGTSLGYVGVPGVVVTFSNGNHSHSVACEVTRAQAEISCLAVRGSYPWWSTWDDAELIVVTDAMLVAYTICLQAPGVGFGYRAVVNVSGVVSDVGPATSALAYNVPSIGSVRVIASLAVDCQLH